MARINKISKLYLGKPTNIQTQITKQTNSRTDINPVSYTHLDVYKRQV